MVTKTLYGERILLGHKNDNMAKVVEFDVREMINKYGDGGTFTLNHKRPGEAASYPVPGILMENGTVKWTVTAADTSKVGIGSAQLTYVVGDVVKHGEIYTTWVMNNLVPGDEVQNTSNV